MSRNFLASLLALLVLGPLGHAEVSLFLGPPGGQGNVQVRDESGTLPPSLPPELQQITLLPVDSTGRSALTSLTALHPRLREDVPGASRILLPHGGGSLYRYRRLLGTGDVAFGYFLVDAMGVAQSLWETPGVGLLGQDDPVPDRVALSPAGDHVLVATTPAAGGDLYEIDLATGGVELRTQSLPPQTFVDGGLCLLDSWGTACTANGVLRFDRAPAAQASSVTFPGGTAWFGGNVAASADGSTLATVAGPTVDAAHVYTFGASGGVTQVSTVPQRLSDAGYLPESPAGPYLALSPDGSCCMWRSEGPTREAWIRNVGASSGLPELQITSDRAFADTLDNPGEVFFVALNAVVLVVGEQDPQLPGEIENGELFQVTTHPAGLFSIRNLTNTSGDTRYPFTSPGELSTEAGIFNVPGTSSFLMHLDRSSGQGELVTARADHTGTTTILPDVKSLDFVEDTGAGLVISARRSPVVGARRELLRYVPGTGMQVLAGLPDAFVFQSPTSDGSGAFASIVEAGGNEWLMRASPGAPLQVFTPSPLSWGPALGFTPTGSLAASIELGPSLDLAGAWLPSGGAMLLAASGPAFVLPGS